MPVIQDYIKWEKEPVRAASTVNIPLSAQLPLVDGIQTVQNDRILLLFQTNAVQNGIYRVTAQGLVTATDWINSRSADDGAEVTVLEGVTNAGKKYFLPAIAPAAFLTAYKNFVLSPYAGGGGSGASLPIVRYVYLVGDASDAVLMGGAGSNVFTTAQEAYDAATAIQIGLGGSNKVVIMVGNTASSLNIGTVTLAANWNPNVSVVGNSSTISFFGNITGTTFTIDVKMYNVSITGSCSSTAGITLTAVNCAIGSLATNSTTGDSGNIILNNCVNSTFGTCALNSTVGNVGNFSMTSCIGCTPSGVTMNASSASGSFSVGTLALSNCRSITFTGAININITNAASTGTIGGIVVGRTNSDIFFNSTVAMAGCTTAVRSDVKISNLTLYDCVFNNTVYINNTGGIITRRGGWVMDTDIQNCIFYNRFRFVQFPISAHDEATEGLPVKFAMKNCKSINLAASAFGIIVQNTDVSFSLFEISDVRCDDKTVGINVYHDFSFPPTIPFMLDGEIIIIKNIDTTVLGVSTYDPAVSSGAINCKIDNCSSTRLGYTYVYLEVYDGDFCYEINNCNFRDFTFGADFVGIIPLTRPFIIRGSTIISTGLNGNTVQNGNPLFKISNSHVQFYGDAQTWTVEAYNSFLESTSPAASTNAFAGNAYTSTIKRLTTESVAGLTLNNTFDQTY